MKTTTIRLPDELAEKLRFEAERRRISTSHLVREAIQAHLNANPRRHLLGAGVGRSGHSDISERIEELLREELHP